MNRFLKWVSRNDVEIINLLILVGLSSIASGVILALAGVLFSGIYEVHVWFIPLPLAIMVLGVAIIFLAVMILEIRWPPVK